MIHLIIIGTCQIIAKKYYLICSSCLKSHSYRIWNISQLLCYLNNFFLFFFVDISTVIKYSLNNRHRYACFFCHIFSSNIFFCRHILFIFLSRYIVLVLLQASFYLYMLFCSISKNVVTYPYGISLLIIIFSTITLSIFTMQNYLFFVFIQYFTYTLKKLIKALIPK